MSNILYIGPYKSFDGWGYAAREYIRSLVKTKYNITIQPIYLSPNNTDFDKSTEFEKYERARYSTYDIVIQHTLPMYYEQFVGHKNVGMCFFETSTLNNYWQNHICLMDKMIVCSTKEKWDIENQLFDIEVPEGFIYTIPIPTDPSKYKKFYSSPSLLSSASPHSFKFYYIGEISTRKNLESLLIAFHSEFKSYELVDLILKVNIVGQSEESSHALILQDIAKTKRTMGIHHDPKNYVREIIISKYLSQKDLYSLHQQCDCFVTGSSAEAFCIPGFDAMAFGNYVIGNKNSGMRDFENYSPNVHLVSSNPEICFCPDKPTPDLYTARDTWYKIDTLCLSDKMREVYLRGKKKAAVDISDYSYEIVAERFNEVLA